MSTGDHGQTLRSRLKQSTSSQIKFDRVPVRADPDALISRSNLINILSRGDHGPRLTITPFADQYARIPTSTWLGMITGIRDDHTPNRSEYILGVDPLQKYRSVRIQTYSLVGGSTPGSIDRDHAARPTVTHLWSIDPWPALKARKHKLKRSPYLEEFLIVSIMQIPRPSSQSKILDRKDRAPKAYRSSPWMKIKFPLYPRTCMKRVGNNYSIF